MSWQFFTDTTTSQLELLGIAFVLSAVIGFERQFHRKAAGLTTHVLVAMGSATFTLISAYGFAHLLGPTVRLDPSRIAAQVVSGIGFLGAGVIFMRRDIVRGLTTAASIWVAAAVGMACGAGMPLLAIVVTGLHLFLLLVLSPLVSRLPDRDHKRLVHITYLDGEGVLRQLLATATEMGYVASILSSRSFSGSDGRPEVTLRARFRGRPPVSELILALTAVQGVLQVRSGGEDLEREEDDEDED
ncbi:MgtC/SapB family protein [Microlunatus panaciterrae]|uniref:Mg2+ transporter-C (MgtC) family protein n=1 Tax=Microlunatus panaciterrae TaxID=400768 RepID=A0ABS2RDV2_9ACTN|nr:MgtC/SapB family protein [Microlunatus panaciterrae]MBM7797117.1 putative Mg2+ transporter-C (MgtC) family protein [Microlunatus panaciterrae]